MKKIFTLSAFLIFFVQSSFSQVIFKETFDPPSTFPAGWKIVDVDQLTPYYEKFTSAWVVIPHDHVHKNVALSTSWYDPVSGTSNDWMWTPAITLTGSKPKRLKWNAIAYDPDFRDGYEVRIMTVPPTGTDGNIGNMISSSTVYFSTSAENASWTQRSVDISALNGSTIYIGFRNNSNDQYLLAIDDIIVENVNDYDLEVSNPVFSTGDYYVKPISQVTTLPLEATVSNNGLKNISNIQLTAEVYNSSNQVVYSASSIVHPALTPNSSKLLTIPSWTPSVSGEYLVKYIASMTETDDNTTNNIELSEINLSDSILARDNDDYEGVVWLGVVEAGEPKGYIGQTFEINSDVYATSVSIGYAVGYPGKKYAAVIWDTDEFGTPKSIIASTDTLLYTTNQYFLGELPISGGKFLLTPGQYVVTAVEFDSALAIVYTSEIYTEGTTWAYVGSLFGGNDEWLMVDDDPLYITNPLMIRLNVKTSGQVPVQLISFTGKNTSNGNQLEWRVGEQSGILEYVVERSTDSKNFVKIGSVKAQAQPSFTYQYLDKDASAPENFYRLKIVEQDHFKYSDIVRISNANASSFVTFSPNPTRNFVTLMSSDSKLLNTNAVLTNIEGKVVQQLKISQLPFKIDLTNLTKGMYLLQLSDKTVHKLIKE